MDHVFPEHIVSYIIAVDRKHFATGNTNTISLFFIKGFYLFSFNFSSKSQVMPDYQ